MHERQDGSVIVPCQILGDLPHLATHSSVILTNTVMFGVSHAEVLIHLCKVNPYSLFIRFVYSVC